MTTPMKNPSSNLVGRILDNPVPYAVYTSMAIFLLHCLISPVLMLNNRWLFSINGALYGPVTFPGSLAFWIIAIILSATFVPKLIKKLDEQGPRYLFRDILRFSGTATRKEFWFKSFGLIVASATLFPIWATFVRILFPWGRDRPIENLLLTWAGAVTISLILLSIAIPLIVRRFKDTGISGWTYLVIIIFNTFFVMTGVLAFAALLSNLAVFLYCGLMPTRRVEPTPQAV